MRVLRLNVVLRVFLKRVVRQVHIDVFDVSSVGLLVRLRAKSSEGALVQVYSQRGCAVQHNINAKVVLEPADQMGPIHVLLDYVACRQLSTSHLLGLSLGWYWLLWLLAGGFEEGLAEVVYVAG